MVSDKNIARAGLLDRATPDDIDDILFYVTLGVILGGRLGFVLFYQPGYYLSNPAAILRIWEGGMAFHGGLIGVVMTKPQPDRCRCAEVQLQGTSAESLTE